MTTSINTTSISMMDLRSQPGTLLDRVFYRSESFVIERAGEPRAVIVPMAEFTEMQRLKQEAKERFFSLVDAVQQRTSQLDPSEIETAVDEAVDAARGASNTA